MSVAFVADRITKSLSKSNRRSTKTRPAPVKSVVSDLGEAVGEVIGVDTREFHQTTGYLVGIDSILRCLTLRYPETGTDVQCYYAKDIDVEPFRGTTELIQVEGNRTYLQDGETPKKVAKVVGIRFLDLILKQYVVKSFVYEDKKICFKEPLTLTPKLIESKQYTVIEVPDIGIDAIGQTRAEMWDEVFAWLRISYRMTLLPDEKLCNEFIKRKHNLLALIEDN